jgi:hypothetical protein
MNDISHSFNLNEISGQFCYSLEQNSTLWPSTKNLQVPICWFWYHSVLLMNEMYSSCLLLQLLTFKVVDTKHERDYHLRWDKTGQLQILVR